MKKICVLALLLCISAPAFAQRRGGVDLDMVPARDQSSVWLGLGGGRSFGTSNFSGYNGWNYGGRVRFELPRSPINLVAEITHNPLAATTSPVVFVGPNRVFIVQDVYYTSVLSVGAGVEVTFPRLFATPYLAADVAYYAIMSDGYAQLNRQGFGLGFGVEFSRPRAPVGFNIEGKYRFANLLSAQEFEGSIHYFQLQASLMIRLF